MIAHHTISFYILNQWLISNIFRSNGNKSNHDFYYKKKYKKLKKAHFALNKKALKSAPKARFCEGASL